MLSRISHDPLTPGNIRARLAAAEQRKAAALEQYEAANAEIAWLNDGLRLFDPEAAIAVDHEPNENATELFPDSAFFAEHGVQPTLRQAIVALMREQPARQWGVTDLTRALAQKGWLPEKGAKTVSNMAGDMARLGQILRPSRGIYVLSPELAAALEGAPGNRK